MDTQRVEIIGQNRLVDQLLRAGLEVAVPLRDRGVDLLVYADQAADFRAQPIQMKASSKKGFWIFRKYEKFPQLIMVHVWNVRSDHELEIYANSYDECLQIGHDMGWTQTASWLEKGAYTTTRPSKKLRALLEPYRMTPRKWRTRLDIISPSTTPA